MINIIKLYSISHLILFHDFGSTFDICTVPEHLLTTAMMGHFNTASIASVSSQAYSTRNVNVSIYLPCDALPIEVLRAMNLLMTTLCMMRSQTK